MLSSFKKFFSIRDRVGLSADHRKTQDFLYYCKEDLHWFSMWFTQVMLTVFSLAIRVSSHQEIQWSIGILFARFVLEMFVLRSVYFSSKFEVTYFTRVVMLSVFGLNCFLVKLLMQLDASFQIWWAPVLLQDIVLHFYIFLQIAIEWAYWDQKQLEWQKELMFIEQLREKDFDCDEKQVKLNVELLSSPLTVNQQRAAKENYVAPEDEAIDQSYKPLKELKLTANIYTISYCAFLKKNKTKYRLKASDQTDVFYRALFMFMIQATFMLNILIFENLWGQYKYNDTVLNNFCLLFSILLLHWQMLPDARSGIYMMKYAICCPDEFNQPVTAFMLGFIQFNTVLFVQICNLLKNIQQKSPFAILTKFAGFGLVAGIPKMLAGSMETFEISKSVGKLSLTRSRKRIGMLGNED